MNRRKAQSHNLGWIYRTFIVSMIVGTAWIGTMSTIEINDINIDKGVKLTDRQVKAVNYRFRIEGSSVSGSLCGQDPDGSYKLVSDNEECSLDPKTDPIVYTLKSPESSFENKANRIKPFSVRLKEDGSS